MERFEVKRGLVKLINSEGGLVGLANKHFQNVESVENNGFIASWGLMTEIKAHYDDDGKLVVDVQQLKGLDLQEFLENEGGRENAMESRKRWSAFLDDSTGYNAKQRGDKAKENSKKASKAKSGINMARKLMQLSSKVTDEMKTEAEKMIAEVEQKLNEGNATRALSLSEKINKMLEGK
ncbi:MAG: hypothetical protein CMB56_003950 [Methanobacteriota archaeon]|nr:MAG: hypothetical protein CMB56_003950 [Euryarchaeota archaeon]|tara:strand:+ start:3550 stop:4086 length:537 start_codon:yes stop_codon:yes gene_type:complete